MKLQALNQAICGLYRQALQASTKAPLVAEDVRAPITRPCGKVMLESGTDIRLTTGGRERSATFRLYYFAADRDNPKAENLAVREAIGEAFLNGIQADGTYLGIDEGVQFEVADGVLEATLDLTWQETLPEEAVEAFTDPDASTETMEILKQTMEVS